MKINEIFGKNIVQGEGPFIGQPATFIRTFGCVYPFCAFCDTPYSWKDVVGENHEMSVREIINEVDKYKNRLVVITGGEPYSQEETYELIDALLNKGYRVQMETSGKANIKNVPMYNDFTIVMSPKQYDGKFLVYNHNVLYKADYYKFVIETEEEMDETLKFIHEMGIDKTQVYLMAKGATREEQLKNSDYVIKQCYEYGFKYSPRLHVLLYDNKRGV